MPEHEQKDTMTDNDLRPAQFAEPPNATVHIADLHHSARIPCTRDDNTHDSDPIAAETWAFALGLAIGRHGPHWARSFARSIVRLHIAEGWLEVFLHEIEEPINAPLDLDQVFACFTEAWKTIAIDQDDTRWSDHEAVTLYAWGSAINPQEGDPRGEWIAERDGMDTDTMAAYRIRKTAIDIATNAAYAEPAYHCADGTCCFSLSLVGSPRQFAGLFRRRIAWDDEAIREVVGAGAVAFLMNRRCRSGEDVGARAPSVGKGWASAQHLSRPCPHGP